MHTYQTGFGWLLLLWLLFHHIHYFCFPVRGFYIFMWTFLCLSLSLLLHLYLLLFFCSGLSIALLISTGEKVHTNYVCIVHRWATAAATTTTKQRKRKFRKSMPFSTGPHCKHMPVVLIAYKSVLDSAPLKLIHCTYDSLNVFNCIYLFMAKIFLRVLPFLIP